MKRILKWGGIVLGVLLGIVLILMVILNIRTTSRLNKIYNIQAESVVIPTDETAIARGEYLARLICVECHAGDLRGENLADEAGLVTIYAANLTPGRGGIAERSNEELVMAIRHGIDPDGKPLIIMPAEVFSNWSEEDLGAVIAYLRTIPAVDNEQPEPRISIIGRALIGLGLFGKPFPAEYIDHDAPFIEMPTIGPNLEYGAYLARAVGCTLCHGDNLEGGIQPENAPPGEIPTSPDITQTGDLADWTEDDFLQLLRTGTTPDGHEIDTDHMPWDMYGRLSDDDMAALWVYLQSLPADE